MAPQLGAGKLHFSDGCQIVFMITSPALDLHNGQTGEYTDMDVEYREAVMFAQPVRLIIPSTPSSETRRAIKVQGTVEQVLSKVYDTYDSTHPALHEYRAAACGPAVDRLSDLMDGYCWYDGMCATDRPGEYELVLSDE